VAKATGTARACAGWKPTDHASLVDRDDALLLRAQLVSSLNVLRNRAVDRKDYAGGANTVVGAIFNQLQFMPVAGRDGCQAPL
jgi:hypothetical protein